MIRKQFIKTLATILGVDPPTDQAPEFSERLEALEGLFVEKASELEQVKEMLTVLIMTNPNVRIAGEASTMPDMFLSGSDDSTPGGRLLN